MEKKKNTIKSGLILELLNLFVLVPVKLRKSIQKEELTWLRRVAIFHYIYWPTSFIIFFFLLDIKKEPIINSIIYRFGAASLLIVLAVISYLFRKNVSVLRGALFASAVVVCSFISWSITFPYPVQALYFTINPALIIASISNSLFLSLISLNLLVVATYPFWSAQFNTYYHFLMIAANIVFCSVLLYAGYLFKKTWIISHINKLLHDEEIQKNIELQLHLHEEVKKFVPPVLVKKIEEQTQKDKPIAIAVDDILMRHKNDVAVLFSDIRNFSQRSTDMEFVEKELIPSSIKLIDMVEANKGIAKQIGDAIFVYYSTEGPHPDAPKEAIIRAFKDAVEGCLIEKQRIKDLGRDISERFFSLTYGPALVGNMASSRHREATVIGSPANLAARMDSLTKEPSFKELIKDGNKILVSKSAKESIDFFEANLKFNEVNLEEMNLIMKSFPDEKLVYLFHITEENLRALNEILIVNELTPIDPEEII